MTLEEFSNEFDVLVKNITGEISLFDEYEKSMYLTLAQESIVKGFYNGTLSGESFEETELLRRFLSELIKDYTYPLTTGIPSRIPLPNSINPLFGERTYSDITLPNDVWFITMESVVTTTGNTVMVTPITLDEYHRIRKNPFRGANDKRALRLDNKEKKIEIISPLDIKQYHVRYISQPEPILLPGVNLLSIDGETFEANSEGNECKLNPVLHRTILETAVNYAIRGKVAQK